jgi:hypothetical protein
LTNEILFYSDSSCSQLAAFEAMSLDNVTFESHGSYGGLLISGNLHSEILSAQTQDGANWYNTRDSNSSMNVQSGDNWTISNLGKRWSELLIDQDSIRLTRFYSDNASGVNDPFYSSIPQTKQPGITVNVISDNTTEAGGTASFTVVLDSEPTASVNIPISSDNVSEGTVSPSSLTFTSSDWNAAQTVTVTGVDDSVVDDNATYNIVIGASSSSSAARGCKGSVQPWTYARHRRRCPAGLQNRPELASINLLP